MADMNLTPARGTLTPQLWDKQFFSEYVRKNRFARYMGTSMNSLIQLKDDLTTKNGDSVTFATVRRLVGAGVTGNTILEGNEEVLDSRGLKLAVVPVRHAVAVSDWDEQKSAIDLRNASKAALQNWMMEKMRADLINSLNAMTMINGVAVPYAASTTTQQNAWLSANSDRVQAGLNTANTSSLNLATSLATVTTTTDKMTGSLLSLAKRRAQLATPHIRPIMLDDANDEEWFVCFMPSLVFRDFRADPNVISANTNARPRETGWKENPLFSGGDLLWDGIFVREIPELPTLAGAGAAGINVGASFLCGAQSLGVAWAQRTKTTTNTRDYGFMHGVGIQEVRGIGKLQFGRDPADVALVDQGIFTIYTTAIAD